jgi:hypothetical protein
MELRKRCHGKVPAMYFLRHCSFRAWQNHKPEGKEDGCSERLYHNIASLSFLPPPNKG